MLSSCEFHDFDRHIGVLSSTCYPSCEFDGCRHWSHHVACRNGGIPRECASGTLPYRSGGITRESASGTLQYRSGGIPRGCASGTLQYRSGCITRESASGTLQYRAPFSNSTCTPVSTPRVPRQTWLVAVPAHRQAQRQVGHGFLRLPRRNGMAKAVKPGKKARGKIGGHHSARGCLS
jgi:hypothetical protein